MTMTLEISTEMARKLDEVAQGRTKNAQAVAQELLAQLTSLKASASSELLVKLNSFDVPAPVWQRYDELFLLRQNERLTETQYAELLRLGDQIEQHHVEKIRIASQLAQIENKSLSEVMQELGIMPRPLPKA